MDEDDKHFLSASHQKCILLSGTECHIINYLLTEFARVVSGNIDPLVFVRTEHSSVRTVMTSGQYSPVRPSCSVSKTLVLDCRVVSGVSLFIINAVIPGLSKEMLIDWMNSGKELMSIHLGGNVKKAAY